jgi:hypothetical protein
VKEKCESKKSVNLGLTVFWLASVVIGIMCHEYILIPVEAGLAVYHGYLFWTEK